jgi:hypothetical protein
LQWKILAKLLTIWSILLPLENFYGHLVYFVVVWYIFPRFGILYQEKSGNPDFRASVFHGENYSLILTKKWVGLHFGRFFHKLIWSPSGQTTRGIFFSSVALVRECAFAATAQIFSSLLCKVIYVNRKKLHHYFFQ